MKIRENTIKFLISLIVLILFSFSCEVGSDDYKWIYIYKTKADYSNNVCVKLTIDKSKISSYPGPGEGEPKYWPVELTEGYLLNGTQGENSGILSITNEEYNQNYNASPGADSLYKLLLEKDPFIEFYKFNDTKNEFYSESGAYGVDTMFINYLIKEDNLDKYFIKIK
ncbi:MAG: hypothetical protein GQ564_12315 [Bacteroidales bacterium]|nr:hypothetical protein [Bacteroidales bacterium]